MRMSGMKPEFTIGCDPEIFLTKEGKAVSAHGVIKGTKKEPFEVPNGAYQVDGMAVEFNTDPVDYRHFESFNMKVVSVMKELELAVKAADPAYRFNVSPVQEFDPEYLAAQPDDAKELGCDPDYNAYTLEANPRPDGDRPFRTGAGHLHIGWGEDIPVDNPDHMAICANFVKMLDCTVGMAMVVFDRDNRRRELYGKAGAFRSKPYGVEYRYPSNAWLKNKARRKVVFSMIQTAISYMKRGHTPEAVLGLNEVEVQRILNEGDVTAAKNCIQYMGGAWQEYLAYNYAKEFPNG